MYSNVTDFLESLEKWEDNYEICEFDVSHSNELCTVVQAVKSKDIESIIEFWKKIIIEDFFELSHPVLFDIKTRAVLNIQYGLANFILMVDEDYEHPWILAQTESVVDVIISKDKIFKISKAAHRAIWPHVHKMSKLDITKLNYNISFSGFLFNQIRPYHFFYDHLRNFYSIGGIEVLKKYKKKIYQSKSFFFPNGSADVIDNYGVYLFPATIGANYLFNNITKTLNEEMELKILTESLMGNIAPLKTARASLVLWYGITGQKRSWLQQIEGCEQLVRHLLQYFPKIELYIDGMTASEGKIISNADDQSVFNEIRQLLADSCSVHSLIGYDYRHKVTVCSTVDMFIANGGTGCIVPLRFCKKPGIVHSNSKLFTFPDEYPDIVKRNNSLYLLDETYSEKIPSMATSYHIPWQHIFNLTADVLNQIKGTNIQHLKVPPVGSVLKEYKKKKNSEEEGSSIIQKVDNRSIHEKQNHLIFQDINKKIHSKVENAVILREIALAFEKSGDIATAFKVMEKAHLFRPRGPIIKKKLEEYRIAIVDAKERHD